MKQNHVKGFLDYRTWTYHKTLTSINMVQVSISQYAVTKSFAWSPRGNARP